MREVEHRIGGRSMGNKERAKTLNPESRSDWRVHTFQAQPLLLHILLFVVSSSSSNISLRTPFPTASMPPYQELLLSFANTIFCLSSHMTFIAPVDHLSMLERQVSGLLRFGMTAQLRHKGHIHFLTGRAEKERRLVQLCAIVDNSLARSRRESRKVYRASVVRSFSSERRRARASNYDNRTFTDLSDNRKSALCSVPVEGEMPRVPQGQSR